MAVEFLLLSTAAAAAVLKVAIRAAATQGLVTSTHFHTTHSSGRLPRCRKSWMKALFKGEKDLGNIIYIVF